LHQQCAAAYDQSNSGFTDEVGHREGQEQGSKLNKQELCKAIVGWKADHDIAIADGTTEIFDTRHATPVSV
jgi:hypothetical protein